MGHAPRNISRYIYFFFLSKDGFSIQYRPSSIAIGNSWENMLSISQMKISRTTINNEILRKWTRIKTEGRGSGRRSIWYNIQRPWRYWKPGNERDSGGQRENYWFLWNWHRHCCRWEPCVSAKKYGCIFFFWNIWNFKIC